MMRARSLLLGMVCLLAACQTQLPYDTQIELHTDTILLARVQVAVADTPAERAQGLMHRALPDDGFGMLFVFDTAAPRTFWMHNTPGPLDMLFLDNAGRVRQIIANAPAFSDRQLASRGPARYVLEVPGGFAHRHHINPGTRIHWVR